MNILAAHNKIHTNQRAFMMPVALTFLVIISSIGLSLLQSSLQAQSSSIRYSYVQMAHIASKAAIDYAEEAYELDPNYAGTVEQDLVITEKYRLTIETVVLYNQGSSAKRVQAFGRVYIPDDDATASFVRDIQASIIRNGEVIVTGGNVDPATYNPLLWLAADEPNSLIQPSVSSQTQYISSIYGASIRDVVEQRGSDANGNPGGLIFGNDDLEMSWDGNARGHQSIGLRFRGLNATQGATINEAYIQFQVDQTKSAGLVDLLVEGVSSDNAPQWTGSYAVDNAIKTTANLTWTPPNWNVVGASGANERVDVTAIVQEIINRSGWNPGNNIAFTISWVQGSGVRTAEKGNNGDSPILYVDWGGGSGGTNYAVNTGDPVGTWIDKSVNNNDAQLAYGSAPTRQNTSINGLPSVRFSNDGVLESLLSSTSSGSAITAFVVMEPRTSSSSNARFLSVMEASRNDDFNTFDGAALIYKNGSSTNLSQYYRNQTGETIFGGIDNNFSIYTSRISDIWVERLLEDGVENYSNPITNINYDIDQVYVGGRRSGLNGTQYADADIAEVIVYDQGLSCTELNEIESYLGAKYGITVSTKTC